MRLSIREMVESLTRTSAALSRNSRLSRRVAAGRSSKAIPTLTLTKHALNGIMGSSGVASKSEDGSLASVGELSHPEQRQELPERPRILGAAHDPFK
jgi:hypothetical protein